MKIAAAESEVLLAAKKAHTRKETKVSIPCSHTLILTPYSHASIITYTLTPRAFLHSHHMHSYSNTLTPLTFILTYSYPIYIHTHILIPLSARRVKEG